MCAWYVACRKIRQVIRMYIKLKHSYKEWLLMLLLLAFMYDASAATRNQCRNAMVVVEVEALNFGSYVGSPGGTITVDTSGARSSTGPVLVSGGTVSAGIFQVSSTIAGCDVYPVSIRYTRTNQNSLTGAGTAMPFNTFVSNPASLFTISPLANVATTVNIGANLDSPNNQTAGLYTDIYIVRFDFQNP